MNLFLTLAIVLVSFVSRAGTITGTVRAEPKSGPGEAAAGKYDSRKFKFAERVNYDALRDFVVFLEGPLGTNPAAGTSVARVITKRTVAQKGAVFSPHVLPVMVGTTVEWPNEDEIFHNVFSISEAKEFDLGLYKKPEIKRVTFDRPGRVDIFCSIHATMNCIILVLENPFFTVADELGRYTLSDIPPGTYKLKAWHERLPSQSRTITVPVSGEIKADFILGIKGLPQY